MESGGRLKRTFPLAAIVLLAASCWIAFRLWTRITLEDALITYRYARNLAVGQGFDFNAGERVLGTTTPLLTLILAILRVTWRKRVGIEPTAACSRIPPTDLKSVRDTSPDSLPLRER